LRPINNFVIRSIINKCIEEYIKQKHLIKLLFSQIFFLFFNFAYWIVVHKLSPHYFLLTSGTRVCFLLFNMAKKNFPLQYSYLTKDNFEIWCISMKAWIDFEDIWITGKEAEWWL
jgi:hypothetical protein